MIALIQDYINLVKEHDVYFHNGDDKNANRLHSQITKIVGEIKNGSSDLKEAFFELLNHSEKSVKVWTATELLGTFENKSIKILRELDDRITSTAHSVLYLWENGMLTKEAWL